MCTSWMNLAPAASVRPGTHRYAPIRPGKRLGTSPDKIRAVPSRTGLPRGVPRPPQWPGAPPNPLGVRGGSQWFQSGTGTLDFIDFFKSNLAPAASVRPGTVREASGKVLRQVSGRTDPYRNACERTWPGTVAQSAQIRLGQGRLPLAALGPESDLWVVGAL